MVPSSSGSGDPRPRSTDPNQKIGPAGFGTNGFITASRILAYRVEFESLTNAAGPAQQVVITDQLSDNTDWASFQWSEIGWGDQLIVVPPNSQHFETNVPVTCLGTALEVQIEAGLRSASGQAYAIFRSIDPATSLPPPVSVGFLPPEDGTGRSQGHVSYTIRPKPGLATGSQIRNVANISFDNQPVIATNQRDAHNPAAGTDPARECLNTIDADTPSGSVQTLGAESGRTFIVRWTSADDPGGSGVDSYDVYVSTNGGSFSRWLERTKETSAVFVGELGRRYDFFATARDLVGNEQARPVGTQAFTTVSTNAPVLAAVADQHASVGSLLLVTNLSQTVECQLGPNSALFYRAQRK
jgi:hypothetical protein